MEMNNKLRQEIEAIIYKTMDTLDRSKTNSEYYKIKFSKMSNEEFKKFISLKFPYRFHIKPFVVEPNMDDINNACNLLKVPLLEKITLPYLYTNKDGVPVNSKECLVGYIHHKKVQQFIAKKNSMSVDISNRDMKTGLLTGHDKNGKSSDREIESLAIMGLETTMKEFTKHKADAMSAKNTMYNIINTKGQVSLEEVPVDVDDSLSKNLVNVYLIGAMINSNMLNEDYYLPYTLKRKKKQVIRV